MTFKMPTPDIRVDAFGDVLPTNRRRFVMGDFFTADQVRAAYEQGRDEAKADGRRYRAFFDAGLPICFMGTEYFDKPSLDAAIDKHLKDTTT